jgi:hypothetical protein
MYKPLILQVNNPVENGSYIELSRRPYNFNYLYNFPGFVTSTLEPGTWIVTHYNNSGNDESGDYNEFSLDFQENGMVVATKDEGSVVGTWSIEGVVVGEGYGEVDIGIAKFVLDFGESAPLNEFINDWDIVHCFTSKVDFFYFSPEYGTITDVLILEKEPL